jgi:hypothetical protein
LASEDFAQKRAGKVTSKCPGLIRDHPQTVHGKDISKKLRFKGEFIAGFSGNSGILNQNSFNKSLDE